MQVQQFLVAVNSEQPERLASFYEEIVGLTPAFEVAPGAFRAGSSSFISLIIEGHDELEGIAKEPARVMLNFVVDDVESEEERLKGQGVAFIRDATLEPGLGTFATFLDPDGNYCQLAALAEPG